MSTNLGTAYVSVMPSMKGFGGAVESGLNGIDTTNAGALMGQRAASGFAGGMAKNGVIIGAASAMASKAFDAVASSADRAISRVDTMRNFPKVMKNLGISAEDAEAAVNKISDGLMGLPTALDAGVASVQRFTSFNNDVMKSADMFLAVNDAILAGGTSAGMQQSALEQLTQAYTKGKMDMMEWRALQQTMPAQLKQIADAMGLTTAQLGAGLRGAEKADEFVRNVSMDEFIETIQRLDKEGGNGFASFAEQAKSATTGIQTAMANLQTAIVRGTANIIDAVGQENISGAINYFSKDIGSIFKDLAVDVKAATEFLKDHSDQLKGALDTLVDIAPTAIKAWAAFKVFQGGAAIFSSIAGTVGGLVRGLGTLGEKVFVMGMRMEAAGIRGAGAFLEVGSTMADASTAMLGMSTGAVGLVAAVGVALVALSAYNQMVWDSVYAANGFNEEQKKTIDAMSAINTSYNEAGKKRDESVAAINKESDEIRALKDEYNGLVDANGQIIEGNEARADEIIGQLASALGVEKEAIYELIDSYGKLGEAADAAAEKRRAQKLLEANEEQYNEALAKKPELIEDIAAAETIYTDKMADAAKANDNYVTTMTDVNDALAGTPEAMGAAVYQYGEFAYAQAGAADAAKEASSKIKESQETLMAMEAQMKNYEGLAAAIDSGDVAQIEEYSARLQHSVVSAENGTRESLEKQVETFQSSYDSIAKAVADGDTSLEDDLAQMGIALQAAKGELERYNSIELNEKFASITLEDGSLVDAQGNVYTWNGTALLDKDGNATVNDVELVDAQGKVYVWNGSSLTPKDTSVSVDTSGIDNAKTAWNLWQPATKYASVIVSRIGDALGLSASGGFYQLHADGGFVTNGPISLGRDRNGVKHVAGEAGREWVMNHADGTTSIVPIENRKYLGKYANVIAPMVSDLLGGNGKNVTYNITLDYKAGDDANKIVRDLGFALRTSAMMEG